MPKFKIEIDWSGYSRGVSTYVVEADTKEEATEMYYTGEKTHHNVVRDDTEKEISSVTQL